MKKSKPQCTRVLLEGRITGYDTTSLVTNEGQTPLVKIGYGEDHIMRKVMDVARINALSWQRTIQLKDGIALSYRTC